METFKRIWDAEYEDQILKPWIKVASCPLYLCWKPKVDWRMVFDLVLCPVGPAGHVLRGKVNTDGCHVQA